MTKEERREMLNKLHKAERQAKWEAEHPRQGTEAGAQSTLFEVVRRTRV
jgi:hypothetical protein